MVAVARASRETARAVCAVARASVEVAVDADGARKVFKLIDALEDSDDVQNVYTNMSLNDEVAAQLED